MDQIFHFCCSLLQPLPQNRALVLGIVGVQGSGKTTLARHWVTYLAQQQIPAVGLSLDDFYYPDPVLQNLRATQPHLIHRGPPGTHDVALALKTLQALKNQGIGGWIPNYDKSAHQGRGDRWHWVAAQPGMHLKGVVRQGYLYLMQVDLEGQPLPLPDSGSPIPIAYFAKELRCYLDQIEHFSLWITAETALWQLGAHRLSYPLQQMPLGWRWIPTPVRVVLLEGWFVGCRPIADQGFDQAPWPVDTAQARTQARVINRDLALYVPLWAELDHLILLWADFRWSHPWRAKAEETALAQGKMGMNAAQLEEFMLYFWRSLHPELFLRPLRTSADVVITLDAEHRIVDCAKLTKDGM